MIAFGLHQLRELAERRDRVARADAVAIIDALFHSYCARPHVSCVCADNPLRETHGPVPSQHTRGLRGRGRAMGRAA